VVPLVGPLDVLYSVRGGHGVGVLYELGTKIQPHPTKQKVNPHHAEAAGEGSCQLMPCVTSYGLPGCDVLYGALAGFVVAMPPIEGTCGNWGAGRQRLREEVGHTIVPS
jgi:hypothetical protein